MGLSRRELLIAAGVLPLAAACTGDGQNSSRRTATADPSAGAFGLALSGADREAARRAQQIGAELDVPVGIVSSYVQWQWRDDFPEDFTSAVLDLSAVPQITWEPWDPRTGLERPALTVADLSPWWDYVDDFAESAAGLGDRINLRVLHEMNAPWYPWSINGTVAGAAEHAKSFRAISERLARAGAGGAHLTWCPNVLLPGQGASLLEAAYPGDDVVDVVGLDGYGSIEKSVLIDPATLFGPTLDALRKIAPDKPVWINETGCDAVDGKAEWITTLFSWAQREDVDAIVWFEVDKDQGDFRLTATAETTGAARAALSAWIA